jgi:CheY-like chemotaxis protein
MSTPEILLTGRVLLLVEDEYLIAAELARALERHGATVVGPVPDVRRALELLARTPRLDGALLDIQLRNERVFAVADALRARGVPFVLASGFDSEVLPEAYREVPVHTKPLDLGATAAALFVR